MFTGFCIYPPEEDAQSILHRKYCFLLHSTLPSAKFLRYPSSIIDGPPAEKSNLPPPRGLAW